MGWGFTLLEESPLPPWEPGYLETDVNMRKEWYFAAFYRGYSFYSTLSSLLWNGPVPTEWCTRLALEEDLEAFHLHVDAVWAFENETE